MMNWLVSLTARLLTYIQGAPANLYVYNAVMKPHDRLMGLDLPHGGQYVYSCILKPILPNTLLFLTFRHVGAVFPTAIRLTPRRSRQSRITLRQCPTASTRPRDISIMMPFWPAPYCIGPRLLWPARAHTRESSIMPR